MTDYADVAQFVKPEDLDAIIAEATKFPVRRGMTEEQFLDTCIERAGLDLDARLTSRFAIGLGIDFAAAADEFVALAGPRPTEKAEVSDWLDLFDGHLEATLAPQLKLFSQDWIGAYLTGTDFDDAKVRNAAADAAASQIINHLNVTGTTSAKRLAAIGIARNAFTFKPDASVAADAAATDTGQAVTTANDPMTTEQVGYHINDLVERMVTNHEASVSDDATLAVIVNDMTDSDDGLALSRVQTMGGDANHFAALRAAMAIDKAPTVRENITNAVGMRLIMGPTPSGAVVPPSAPAPVSVATPEPTPVAGKRTKGSKAAKMIDPPAINVPRSRTDISTAAGAVNIVGAAGALEALKLLRLHGADSDDKIGQALGVSRGTVKNFADGKSVFTPTAPQLAALRSMITERAAGMQSALTAIS